LRLVIDLQGAQGSSRLRGIGRYSRELALAMARAPGPHETVLLLNAALPFEELRDEFLRIVPPTAIRVWEGLAGTGAVEPASANRRAAAATLRAEVVADLAPDIVHVASLFEGSTDDVIAQWPAALRRPPTVATCYDLIPLIQQADYLDGAWSGALARWYFRQLHEMSLCEGLLAISESSRQEAIVHLGYPAERVANIRAGVAPGFAPQRLTGEARAAFLRRLGLSEGFILFVGAGDRRKNVGNLIRAFGLLPPPLRARHRLAVVGRVDKAEVQGPCQEAGLAPSEIIAIDFVAEADLPALYSACALFVLPSLHEGFGLPAAEAMACGAPVIASGATSLPEVIGRADALFDPTSPGSIAERMRAALEDEHLRRDLAEHGERQAATFTWPDSARRAWGAIEAVHAALRAEAPRRRSPRDVPPARKPRLALISPLPPDASGIADYTAELAPALAAHYDITLVCDRGTTSDKTLEACFPVISTEALPTQAQGLDRVLYQVGNSAFHARQLESLLPLIPGVVTLHDAFLSGLRFWQSQQAGGQGPLLRELLASHGWAAVARGAEDALAAVERYPASLAALTEAMAVIQHSRHARDIALSHYGATAAPIAIVPQLHRAPPLPERAAARRRLGVAEDAFLVCSFGLVAKRKLPDRLFAAWPAIAAAMPGAALMFVGEALSEVADLFQAGAGRATGRVDNATYRLWLAAADVAVQLRTGSRGETSRAVLDCLAAGLPTIVNADGAMAELPAEVVHMLPGEADPQELASAILALRDAGAAERMSAAARAHVARDLAPERIARQVRDVIEDAYASGPAARRHAATLGVAAEGGLTEEDLRATARAIVRSFPTSGPPRLLLDAALLDQAAGEARRVLRGWFAEHPADLRTHAVRARAVGLLTDPAAAIQLLGLAPFGAEPEAVLPRGCDTLLCAAEASAVPATARAAARRHGARVVLLCGDEAVAEAEAEPPIRLAGLPPASAVAALLGRGAAGA